MNLRKIVHEGGNEKVFDYDEGIEHNEDESYAYHSEGRVRLTDGEINYEYTIRDHLGNSRVSFSDLDDSGYIDTDINGGYTEILQENHYYPFGMTMEGAWIPQTGIENTHQYNGKELHKDLGLNLYMYGARYYDPAICRFTGVDPIADQYAFVSAFNYAENSPIANIDLWGLQKYWTAGGEFLHQFGDDNSMRIVSDAFLGNSEGASNDMWFANSIPAFKDTDDNRREMLGKWARKNQNSTQEFAMSIFEKHIETEDGTGYFSAIVEGTLASGGHKRVNPGKSLGPQTKSPNKWHRSETIHTHPVGDWQNFSNEPQSSFMGGDVQWAIEKNVNLYLVPPSGNTMGVFRMKDYFAYVKRDMVKANKEYYPRYGFNIYVLKGHYRQGEQQEFRNSIPHVNRHRPHIRNMAKPVGF